MYEVKESDWKILRKKVPVWQEEYMNKLNNEYIQILQKDENPASKFWELNKRIKKDQNSIGVIIDMRRSRMINNLLEFLAEDIITIEDLDDFSDELKDCIHYILSRSIK